MLPTLHKHYQPCGSHRQSCYQRRPPLLCPYVRTTVQYSVLSIHDNQPRGIRVALFLDLFSVPLCLDRSLAVLTGAHRRCL
jgi:hypothetical protein